MKIVVEIDKNEIYPESIVPDSLSLAPNEWGDAGIDGTTIFQIYDVVKEVLSVGSDFAAIAGFIYILVKDHRARVTVGDEPIDNSQSKEEIEETLERQQQKEQ